MISNRSFRSLTSTTLVKLYHALPVVLLIGSSLFVFGPVTIYTGNSSDFAVPLSAVIYTLLLPGLSFIAAMLLLGFLLPETVFRRYAAVMLAVGVLLWIQGNFIVWDYGLADGRGSNWSETMWRGWVDGALWLLLLLISLIYFRSVYRVSTIISVAVILVQVAAFFVGNYQTAGYSKHNAENGTQLEARDAIFGFSSKTNVIHIILDELQSQIFHDIIETDIKTYSQELDGFTYFQNTIGAFPTTQFSIPAILSTKYYLNHMTVLDFTSSVYTEETLPSFLYKNGYQVDLTGPLAQEWYCKGLHSNCYEIPVPYTSSAKSYQVNNTALLLELTLFRYLPHFLKNVDLDLKDIFRVFYNTEKYDSNMPTIQGKGVTHYEAQRHFSHEALLQDFVDRLHIIGSKPVYKFIHITTTHYPAVLGSDCRYAGDILKWSWNNISVQAKCGFDQLLSFIRKLKSSGIYDSSTIVLHADHGYWKIPESSKFIKVKNLSMELQGYLHDDPEYFSQIVCSALPFLAIKPAQSKGPLQLSSVAASITDIPATISSLVKLENNPFTGAPLFGANIDPSRERKFFYYDRLPSSRGYLDRLDEFLVKGDPLDKASWHFITSHVPGPSRPVADYKPLGKIDIGTADATPFLRAGWSTNEGSKDGTTYMWAIGKSASIFYPLPKGNAVKMAVSIKIPRLEGQQAIRVIVDGKKIGDWRVGFNSSNWRDMSPGSWNRLELIIPALPSRPDISTIEFVFSQYQQPNDVETRRLAALFESIEFSPFAEQ